MSLFASLELQYILGSWYLHVFSRHTEWTLVSASEVEAATPNNHNTETTETAEMKNEEG